MLKKIISAGILLTVFMAVSALADQAAWISKSEAYKAGQMINPDMELREYCAPCGDTRWKPVLVNQVEIKHQSSDFYQVEVNKDSIDLAYVYIMNKDGKWQNLAMMLGLSVSDVPEFLQDAMDTTKNVRNVHPLNKILDECIAKDNSTAGMVNCFNEAYESWDAELNKVYKELKALLNADQQTALKTSQREWSKYRDLEFKLMGSIYESLEGTMYLPMRAADRVDMVEKRTLELKSYVDLIKNK